MAWFAIIGFSLLAAAIIMLNAILHYATSSAEEATHPVVQEMKTIDVGTIQGHLTIFKGTSIAKMDVLWKDDAGVEENINVLDTRSVQVPEDRLPGGKIYFYLVDVCQSGTPSRGPNTVKVGIYESPEGVAFAKKNGAVVVRDFMSTPSSH